MYFKNPALKKGCNVSYNNNQVSLNYAGDTYSIELDNPSKSEVIFDFLTMLNGDHLFTNLVGKYRSLDNKEITQLLTMLDDSFLLRETVNTSFKGDSGINVLIRLEDLYHNQWIREKGETKFAQLVLDGVAPPSIIQGWAFEYYHITLRAHDCITPAISKLKNEFQKILIEYFHDEYRHDKILIKSLYALGYKDEEIARSIPLPYTNAIMNLLAKWAHLDQLSFMAALFIFEGTKESGKEYIDALKKYALPKDFVKGQSLHNDINTDGDHGSISRKFYQLIDYINMDQEKDLTRNMRLLFETERKQHQNIVSYYGNLQKPIIRLI